MLPTHYVVPAKAGTITPGRGLAKIRRSVLGPPDIDKSRGMGPCVWEVCHDGGGREAVGSLALDAVSRLGLPPVPSST